MTGHTYVPNPPNCLQHVQFTQILLGHIYTHGRREQHHEIQNSVIMLAMCACTLCMLWRVSRHRSDTTQTLPRLLDTSWTPDAALTEFVVLGEDRRQLAGGYANTGFVTAFRGRERA